MMIIQNNQPGLLFINPFVDKTLKSTETLNVLSKSFRGCSFRKNTTLKEGFEINPVDFVWEYQITYNNSLIVFKELDSKRLKLWVYKNGDNDIRPFIEKIVKVNLNQKGRKDFCDLIKVIIGKL